MDDSESELHLEKERERGEWFDDLRAEPVTC